jgi:hypothetical protein
MLAKEEKTNLYLLAIVGIVAVVGIVIVVLGNGQNIDSEDADITGKVISGSSTGIGGCTDTDGGNETTIYGEVTFAGRTYVDICADETHVTERMCNVKVREYDFNSNEYKTIIYPIFSQTILCGSGRSPGTCSAGACS